MDKIAICIVGQIRTGEICFPSIRHYIGDLWTSCDFFIHTWDVESLSPWHPKGSGTGGNIQYFPVTEKKISVINHLYKPKSMVVDSYEGVIIRFPEVKLYAQFYSMKLCNQIKNDYEFRNSKNYTYVVKLRPDLLIHKSKSLVEDLELVSPGNIVYADVHGRNNQSNYVLEDLLFMGRFEEMNWAMNFFDVRTKTYLHGLDWQSHMMRWLNDGLGILSLKMKNNYLGNYQDEFLRAGDHNLNCCWGSVAVLETDVNHHWRNDNLKYYLNKEQE